MTKLAPAKTTVPLPFSLTPQKTLRRSKAIDLLSFPAIHRVFKSDGKDIFSFIFMMTVAYFTKLVEL